MKTQATKTTLNAAEITIFRALTVAVLSETAATLTVIPPLKTPFFDRAKALGAGHQAALIIASRIIARMEQRQVGIEAAATAKRKAARYQEYLFDNVVSKIYNAQPSRFVLVPDSTIYSGLETTGIRATKKVIAQVRAAVLHREIETYVRRFYRTCCNGTETVSFGPAGVSQNEYDDWNLYRGRFKGWVAKIKDTQIQVSPDFARMPRRVLQGTLILGTAKLHKAEKKGLPERWDAHRVTYLAQGRGNELFAATGILVRDAAKSCLIRDTFAVAARALKKQQ